MRKLELYNTTISRISELQKQLGVQKEKFLDGQSDYLMRINDKMTKIRNDEDSKRGFTQRVKFAFNILADTKDARSSAVVAEMNELLRRTQMYLNIVHDIEMSEAKLNSLIGQAEILEEQALVQERDSYVNTIKYVSQMTIEQKMNQLIVADNSNNLANLTPERQKLFMDCLGYTKDLLVNPSDKMLNDVAKDLYEGIKEMDMSEEGDTPVKTISPLVLNSLAITLMEYNKEFVDSDNELDMPCYYDEVFGHTGWNREYAMNEYVDINGIIDQGMPIEQVIISEVANRIEELNSEYDSVLGFYSNMDEDAKRDLYLMTEQEFIKKYDCKVNVGKLKKYITSIANRKVKAIDEVVTENNKEENEMENMA